MKIVKIMGGLGNQMFQYAFALALKNIHNEEVLLDTSFFETKNGNGIIPNRDFQLDIFNVGLNKANKGQVFKTLYKRDPQNPQKLVENKIIEINSAMYDSEIAKLSTDKYYEGYFQTEKYFKEYREELLKDFTLNKDLDEQNLSLLEQIKNSNSVSLHIRRGDYLKLQDLYAICDLAYYKKAIEYIMQFVKGPSFYVFSDDISWVKENLKIDYQTTFVDINDDKNYCDLELMRNCKHNIIANSSFSWWGAWLNENPQKIVVAPEKWFVKETMLQNDIIPTEWVDI